MPIVLKGKKNNIELQVPGCSGGEGAVTSVNGQTGVVVLDIPSKVSELENDAGYLTEHQSLDALATKEALNDGLAAKQDKLTAGANITIENNVISASGSGIGGTSNHAELSNLDFAHSGHTGFASTEDIPRKLSQLENDSEFITSASVPTKVSQLENDKNYATTSQIPTKISQLDNDESYLTSTTADAQGYVKQTELDKKQDKLTAGSGITISDNNTITATTTYTLPIAGQGKLGGVALYGHKDETDVYNNDFAINQSNGIIEMRPAEKVISKPDTMDQATYANYVRDFHLGGVKLKPTSLLTVDDDGYIDVYTAGLKSEIVPTNVGAFTNDAGYITEKAIPTVPTKVSELENDSNFITNSDIPTNVSYFTNDAGYLTEHQNLDAYATKTELTTGLAEKQATLTAGANITIENNVISASGGGGGEPDAYIKSASVSGNTLTLTNKDDTTVAFTPSGGGGSETYPYYKIVGNTETTETIAQSISINKYTASGASGFSFQGAVPATKKRSGTIIPGTGLEIPDNNQGHLNLLTASTTQLGGVKVDGSSITANDDGVISAHFDIPETPVASTTQTGVVKVGDGLSVAEDGTLTNNVNTYIKSAFVSTQDNSLTLTDNSSNHIIFAPPKPPTNYLSSASVSGNTLTIHSNSGGDIVFTPSTSGGSGGGVSGYHFTTSQTFSDADKARLKEAFDNKNIYMTIDGLSVLRFMPFPNKFCYIVINPNGVGYNRVLVYAVDIDSNRDITSSTFTLFMSYYLVSSQNELSGNILTSDNYSEYISVSGNDWNITNDVSNSELYNAKEIYIMYMYGSYIGQSYLRFDYDASGTTLGDRNGVEFLLDNDDVGRLKMMYNGTTITFDGGTIIKILYKT